MQKVRMVAVAIVCCALLCAGASTASAQALDEKWFQVDAAIKGELLDPVDGSVTKANFKRTAYFFVYYEGDQYNIALFSETAPGVWNYSGGGAAPTAFITGETIFMPFQTWVLYTPDPTIVVLYMHGKFTLKLNKDDSLKKAKFSILGATIAPTTFDPGTGEILFGNVKIKTKMIDEDDLPAGLPLP